MNAPGRRHPGRRRSSSRAGRDAAPERRARVLLVDDDERNLLAVATVLEDLGEVGRRALGRGGAAPPAQGRVRGHPARRLHARHGRLRDRPDHPRARADQAHPDRLPVGGQQGERASDARLCDGRGRLCVQAGRPDRAALEGRGVRRPVREDQGDRAQGARRSRRCSTPICAPMPSGCAPSRSCAAPSSARRRSSSRCRWCSISSRYDAEPRVPDTIVSGDFEAITGFTFDDVRRPTRHLWADRLHPDDRDRVLAALEARRTTGRCRSNIAGNAPTAATSISSTRPCCSRTATAGRSSLPAR